MRPGVKIQLNGAAFVAPSLSTRDLITLDDQDRAFAALGRDATMAEMVERAQRVPRFSLLRNYPADQVEAAISAADLWELNEAAGEIFKVTFGGRKPTETGEAEAPASSPAK